MGESKYDTLGMEYPLRGVPSLDKSEAVKARDIIMNGIKSRLRRDRV